MFLTWSARTGLSAISVGGQLSAYRSILEVQAMYGLRVTFYHGRTSSLGKSPILPVLQWDNFEMHSTVPLKIVIKTKPVITACSFITFSWLLSLFCPTFYPPLHLLPRITSSPPGLSLWLGFRTLQTQMHPLPFLDLDTPGVSTKQNYFWFIKYRTLPS